MKRQIIAVSIAVIALASAWSQPKVAVLDAIIPKDMESSVIVPVTEKIVERLVVSGRFTVLDRANIDSVLKEREFQMSGMVSDQDVVTAGKYLGADFVVVAKVQKVSDTYFISAKMINIKTGVIANQTSAEGEGKLSTLIDLASQVGEVLSGGAVTALSSTGETKDISKPAATPAQPAAPTPPAPPPPAPKAKEKLKTHLLVSYGFTSGSITDSSSGSTATTGAGDGFDANVLVPVFGGLCVVGSVDIASFVDGALTNQFVDIAGGLGYALKLGAFVPYVDVKGGGTIENTSSTTTTQTLSGTGGCFGLDVGLNFDLGKLFTIGVRYQYIGAALDFGSSGTGSGDMSVFFLSAGIRF